MGTQEMFFYATEMPPSYLQKYLHHAGRLQDSYPRIKGISFPSFLVFNFSVLLQKAHKLSIYFILPSISLDSNERNE